MVSSGLVPVGVVSSGVFPMGVVSSGVFPLGVVSSGVLPSGGVTTGLVSTGVVSSGVEVLFVLLHAVSTSELTSKTRHTNNESLIVFFITLSLSRFSPSASVCLLYHIFRKLSMFLHINRICPIFLRYLRLQNAQIRFSTFADFLR